MQTAAHEIATRVESAILAAEPAVERVQTHIEPLTQESEGRRLLIWADTCIHYVVAVQRPEWQIDVDDDKDKAVANRKRILDMAATDELFVAGFHIPFPGLGLIEKSAGGYRWVQLVIGII